MPAGKTRRPGCENCRARHLKCDRAVPCAPCAKKGLTCARPQKLRFSHSFYSNRDVSLITRSTRKLQRASQRQKIQFVDQTLETVRSYDIELGEADHESQLLEDDLSDEQVSTETHGRVPARAIDPNLTSVHDAPLPPNILPPFTDLHSQSRNNHELISDAQSWCYQNVSSGESPSIAGNISSPLSLQNSKSYPDHGTPLETSVDAELAKNFLHNLGPALDPWDDCRRFAADLLEEAAQHSKLLEALLSASALHMSVLGTHPELRYERGLQKRLASPLLTSKEDLRGGACVALLQRITQNIGGSAFEQDNEVVADLIWPTASSQSHQSRPSDSLESKVAWAGLWQEMFLSVMHHRPVNVDVSHSCLGQDIPGNEDRTWASRIFLHLLDAIQYCFGDDRNPATYDSLVIYLATWAESKPESFRPVFIHKNNTGAGFPEIWLLNSAVASGLQWYHLVRVLLLAHNPRLPQFGAAKRSAKKTRDSQIRDDVKVICGIAESMEETTPAHLIACMAISLVGDRFTNYTEQVALLNILSTATGKFGWSTASVSEDLKETWGWLADN